MKQPTYLGHSAETVYKAIVAWSTKKYTPYWINEEFGIDNHTLKTITKTFGIMKNHIPEAFENYIEDLIGTEKFDSIREIEIDSAVHEKNNGGFIKGIERKQQRKINEALKLSYGYEVLGKAITDIADGIVFPKSFILKTKKQNKVKNKAFFSSDWHLGNKKHLNILNNVEAFTRDIATSDCTDAHIFVTGDIVDTIAVDGMHLGMTEEMYLKQVTLVREATEVMMKMVRTIVESGKKVKLYMIPGNHDRVVKEHNLFDTSFAKLALFMVIEGWLKNIDGCEVIIGEKMLNFAKIENTVIPYAHGDDGIDSLDKESTTFQYVRQNPKDIDCNFIYITGHRHNFFLKTISDNIIHVGLPSLIRQEFNDGSYSSNKGYYSSCGYLVVDFVEGTYPNITFKHLPN